MLDDNKRLISKVSAEYPRYASIKTFFQLPVCEISNDYEVAMFGIPFDGGVSYRPGARFAPTRIREISSLGRGYNPARCLNWMNAIQVVDVGDSPTLTTSIDETHRKIENFTDTIVKVGKRFLAIGGDHSCSLALLRSAKKKYGTISLIHFDAHIDTYPLGYGGSIHHGAFLRKAIEEDLINLNESIQIGLRGPWGGSEDITYAKEAGILLFDMDTIRDLPVRDFVKRIPKLTSSPVYITFDIDCLDPAYAPGTGTPIPGGLTTYEVKYILQNIQIGNLIAADIVEVNPAYDSASITSIAAVDIMSEILNIMAL